MLEINLLRVFHKFIPLGERIGATSVVRERPLPNGSGSGDPELQGLASERWQGTGPRPT